MITKYLTMTLSIISLLISLLVSWLTLFRPADIRIAIPNRVCISGDPTNVTPGTYSIKLTLNFTNNGANVGAVSDLLVVLSGNKITTPFRTYLEVVNPILSLSSKDTYVPETKEFNPFQVNAKETVVKTILFRQFDLSKSISLDAEQYRLSLFVRLGNRNQFQHFLDFHFTLDNNDLSLINKKTVTLQNDGRNLVSINEQVKPIDENENLIKNFSNSISNNQ